MSAVAQVVPQVSVIGNDGPLKKVVCSSYEKERDIKKQEFVVVLKAASCLVLKNRVYSSQFCSIYHRGGGEYKQH